MAFQLQCCTAGSFFRLKMTAHFSLFISNIHQTDFAGSGLILIYAHSQSKKEMILGYLSITVHCI